MTHQEQELQQLAAGMRIGLWLATEIRPQLARWGRSADRRVRIQALMLSSIIEARAFAEDWQGLDELRALWEEHSAAEVDGGASDG